MEKGKCFIVSVFLFSIFSFSAMLFGQRVIDLNKVWGDMRVLGDDIYDNSGSAVAKGDINGDGYMDLIIGAPWASHGGRSYAGETYVIFGSLSPPATIDLNSQSADITVYGDDEVDRSGSALASGDINGDGYDDIIIGAPVADPGGRSSAGETYVIFGCSFPSPPYILDLNSRPADITVYGDDAHDFFGHAIASGDINNDGYDDIIIGAPWADPPGGTNSGETYVIFGSSSPPSTIDLSTESADITIYGDSYATGDAVASGDVNGEGFGDIIISSPHADPGGRTAAGETYVIFGSSNPPPTIDLSTESADITIYGDDAYDESGQAVGSGDVNGDGYDDIIIGAMWADYAGETYVIFADSFRSPPYTIDLSTQSADITIYGDDAGDCIGQAVASGDVNGDGYHDIIISACGASPYGRLLAGETYVIFGSSSPPPIIDLDKVSADITIYGDDADDMSGYALASGDVNGDGYDDVIIGAPYARPPGRPDAGKTYVIFGGEHNVVSGQGPGAASCVRDFNALNGNIWKTFKAFGPGNVNGEVSVANGDVTGDGIPDIVVGQRSMGASSFVRVFAQDGTLLWTFRAFGTGNTNGMVNVAVGDVDDDVGEIVVGQGPGGDSYVRIFEYGNSTPVTTWKAFGGGNVSGEVRVAAGRTAGSYWPVGQIITGQAHGGESYVRVWDFGTPPTLYNTFRAFGGRNTSGGVDVGVGFFNEYLEGIDLIVVGQGGPGDTTAVPSGSIIRIFNEDGMLLSTFRAFGGGNVNGRVTVSGGQADDDVADEIIVGQAIGGDSYWRAFNLDGSLIRTVKAFGGGNTSGQVDVAGASKLKSAGAKSKQQ